MNLDGCGAVLRALSEPTRIRLLALLEAEELSVAELAAVSGLAQPRVSTHLAKLKELGLVRDRRAGVSAFYRMHSEAPAPLHALWAAVRTAAKADGVLADDAMRLQQTLAQRAGAQPWLDAVASDMERHYSPGRTWEAVSRSLVCLLDLGAVLDLGSGDGAIAELIARRARHITCIDASERAVSAAATRLADYPHIDVHLGDMHALTLKAGSFDLVLMLQALPYSADPGAALSEATRMLKRGGRLVLSALARHRHRHAIEDFGHRNKGFGAAELERLAGACGLRVDQIEASAREKRPPHFEVITLLAHKP